MNKNTKCVLVLTEKQIVSSKWFWIVNITGVFVAFIFIMIQNIYAGLSMLINKCRIDEMGLSYMVQVMVLISMFIIVTTYCNAITRNIVEENRVRIIDNLLFCMKPLEILTGKIIGYLQIFILQISAITAVCLLFRKLLNTYSGIIFYPDICNLLLIIIAVISGFIMYGYMFAALSSFADNMHILSRCISPGIIITMISFMVAIRFVGGTEIIVSRMLLLIPFVSSGIAVIYGISGTFSIIETIICICLMLAQTIGIAIICNKIYEKGLRNVTISKGNV